MRKIQLLNAGKRRTLVLLVVCGLALFLPGCRNALGPEDVPGNEADTVTLELTIARQGAARTIVRFTYIVSILQGVNHHNNFAPEAASFQDGSFSGSSLN